MIIRINKKIFIGVLKQAMARDKRKRDKQIQYHKGILKNPNKKQTDKIRSFHRLKKLQDQIAIDQSKQKSVMPGIGDAGHQLAKQGGLAKSIFPFDAPKPLKPNQKKKK